MARPLRSEVRGTLPRGAPVARGDLGTRVFADRRHGFALALVRSGATYPAASSDGGRTWRVDGPLLFSPPAGGPVAVDTPGVAGSELYFAWLSDIGEVVDASADGGRHWWQTSFPGEVIGMLASPRVTRTPGAITAIVAGPTADPAGRGASVWEYRTTDGRRWSYVADINVTA